MRKFLVLSVLVLSVLSHTVPALAACETHSYSYGGRFVTCFTCCYPGSGCSTSCY